MDSCDAYEPLLADALFGELDSEERVRLEAHLADCEGCAQTLRRMQETLDVMDRRERPAPSADFWDAFADYLDAEIDFDPATDDPAPDARSQPSEAAAHAQPGGRTAGRAGRTGQTRWLPSGLREAFPDVRVPAWTRRGALALLLVVVGVFLGRTLFASSSPSSSALPADAQREGVQNAPLAREARLCLARSKALLLEMQTLDPAGADLRTLDLPGRKSSARTLAAEANTLETALETAGRERLRALLAELRAVLLQIAALENENSPEDLDRINVQVNESQLVLRINLEELRLGSLLRPANPNTQLSLDLTTLPLTPSLDLS